MSEKIIPPHIYLAQITEELGLGSFSTSTFAKGETVEAAPVIVLTEKYKNLPKEIKHRVYNWGRLSRTKPETSLALALG